MNNIQNVELELDVKKMNAQEIGKALKIIREKMNIDKQKEDLKILHESREERVKRIDACLETGLETGELLNEVKLLWDEVLKLNEKVVFFDECIVLLAELSAKSSENVFELYRNILMK